MFLARIGVGDKVPIRAICVGLLMTSLLAVTETGYAALRPYQWTTKQAATAIRAQGSYLYADERGQSQGLVRLACKGRGKAVQHRYTGFRCAASFTGGAAGTITAKTRRAGGLCWSLTATVPGGCLASGDRAPGSIRDAFLAWRSALTVSPAYTVCVASGIGFYSCWWSDTVTVHRGTVVFSPAPKIRMLS